MVRHGIVQFGLVATLEALVACQGASTPVSNERTAGPSLPAQVESATGPMMDGSTLTIAGGSFGEHELAVEWLGGGEGPLEQAPLGEAFSRPGWDSDPTQGGLNTPFVDDTRTHSHSKAIRSRINPGQWASGFGYTPGHDIHSVYMTWWVYIDPAPGEGGQWKSWRIMPSRIPSDGAGKIYLSSWWNASDLPGMHTIHIWCSASTVDWDGYPGGDGGLRWLRSQDVTSLRRWTRFEVYAQESSSAGVRDGTLEFRQLEPGSPPRVLTNWRNEVMSRKPGYDPWQWLVWQNYFGNGFTEANAWIDDIYIQFGSEARVELGDASDWDGCTHREIQPVTQWTPDSITASLNHGAFAPGTQVYLYVITEHGAISNGFPLRLR